MPKKWKKEVKARFEANLLGGEKINYGWGSLISARECLSFMLEEMSKIRGIKKSEYAYMHTLEGKPARYKEGEQIRYSNDCGRNVPKLVPTLKQIRKEQKLSHEWRLKRELSYYIPNYGHIRVKL